MEWSCQDGAGGGGDTDDVSRGRGPSPLHDSPNTHNINKVTKHTIK